MRRDTDQVFFNPGTDTEEAYRRYQRFLRRALVVASPVMSLLGAMVMIAAVRA